MNDQIVQFFFSFFLVTKGLMSKKWRQGHLLLKLNTEFDNTCRCWMLPFCAFTMRLGALLLPRLQQVKMRLQQILNWITACIDWIVCHCYGVPLRSSFCWCLVCCCAFVFAFYSRSDLRLFRAIAWCTLSCPRDEKTDCGGLA